MSGHARFLACGQCHGCLLERARQHAVRCMHEASLYDENCFLTLTFKDSSIVSLDYVYFQLFMKRLRARFPNRLIRFFMCGEYGDTNGRPHFHSLLFNFNFPDLVYLSTTGSGCKLYRSKTLEDLWPLGFSSVGSVTFESAGYIARYNLKKAGCGQTNDIFNVETGEIVSRTPEFIRMSLKPGIGHGWLQKFRTDVYPKGNVVVNGHEARAPRYYDKKFRESSAAGYIEMSYGRRMEQDKYFKETLPGRLEARCEVSKARIRQLKRELL